MVSTEIIMLQQYTLLVSLLRHITLNMCRMVGDGCVDQGDKGLQLRDWILSHEAALRTPQHAITPCQQLVQEDSLSSGCTTPSPSHRKELLSLWAMIVMFYFFQVLLRNSREGYYKISSDGLYKSKASNRQVK